MSTVSDASLGSLRIQAQQRADLEGNGAVSTPEWNQYISQSVKELKDLLVGAYGSEYYIANTYQLTLSNSQLYPLPNGTSSFIDTTGSTASKFYKLIGVDLQYSASPSGWVTLRNFMMIERNKYAYPNSSVNFNGYSNLRYRISGNNIMFMPTPMAGQVVQLWYIPAPRPLQYLLPSNITLGSQAVTLADNTGLAANMNIYDPATSFSSTVQSVTGSTSLAMADNAVTTSASEMLYYWNDSTLVDGLAGWEEYIVIDAAIKAQIKQENDIQPLLVQKADIKARIESMAEGRDAGQAFHVSDVLGFDGLGWDDGGGW